MVYLNPFFTTIKNKTGFKTSPYSNLETSTKTGNFKTGHFGVRFSTIYGTLSKDPETLNAQLLDHALNTEQFISDIM